jgi:hypothetical protein
MERDLQLTQKQFLYQFLHDSVNVLFELFITRLALPRSCRPVLAPACFASPSLVDAVLPLAPVSSLPFTLALATLGATTNDLDFQCRHPRILCPARCLAAPPRVSSTPFMPAFATRLVSPAYLVPAIVRSQWYCFFFGASFLVPFRTERVLCLAPHP